MKLVARGSKRHLMKAGDGTTLCGSSSRDRLWEVSDLVALLEAYERGLERAA